MTALERAIRHSRQSQPVFLLSEVKSRSPRDGDLLGDRDPGALARTMVDAGADGVSVVTEPNHFGGSNELLETVSRAVGDDIPILAKDFFERREQIDRAHAHGADAVLLICQQLEHSQLRTLFDHCLDVGVDPLVETHQRAEIETANDLGASVVGINNRNIAELERDDGGVERTESLAPLVRDEAVLLSESSITTASAVSRVVAAGVDAVLVGTAILKAPTVATKIDELRGV